MQDDAKPRPNSIRKRVKLANRVIRWFLVSAAVTRIFVRPMVIGRENLSLEGAMLVVPNHKSTFDPIAIFGPIVKYRPDITFLAMAELFKNWLMRAILEWFGIIPVARGTDAAIEASQRGITVLEAGGAVAAFIEGKISTCDDLLEPKSGIAFMALATGAPIVPVAMVGTEGVKRPKTRPLHYGWRRRYVIVIGEPIIVTRMENATKEDRDELSARVMDAIRSQIDTAKLALAA